ncbi:CD276 antigen [Neoarius graeffei]|uniref:CD276 antigen n=1 Tax=Neoarius graeffei TaxID=443677 RepID=UPI00298C93A8|nr:CD276 antigen [Neoarius graeffei]XP_060781199.1 CD276 antigen [Neoarius graeffei]XP_060781200.1 CD276 antigen [Neoarius graeffei]
MNNLIFLLSFLTTCTGFKVSTPAGHIIAVRGQPAILGCEFTPDSTSDLSSLVVTWQRVEDARVVHSFYFQRNQLDLQSPVYRNRTALFVSELWKGNATLRIKPVGPTDVGGYLCTVSSTKGTDKATVQLEYGAFYTEPRLSVNMSGSTMTLLYETEGFPKPEVMWFGEHGEILSGHTEFIDDADGAGGAVGLYYLKSSYTSQNSSLNVTFMLKNQLLNQHLLRPVNIISDGENHSCRAITTAFTVFCVLCVLLLLCVIILLIKMRRTAWRHSHLFTNGTASRRNENETGSL